MISQSFMQICWNVTQLLGHTSDKHSLKCQNWASSGPLRVAAGQSWPGSGLVLALKAMFMG